MMRRTAKVNEAANPTVGIGLQSEDLSPFSFPRNPLFSAMKREKATRPRRAKSAIVTTTTTFLGWFFEPAGGDRVGPLTAEQIVELCDTGKVRPGDWLLKAWQDDQDTYYYLSGADAARREAR
jgi:hypothetical protein